jgi:hypothetical protein
MLKFALGRPPGVFVSFAFLAGFAHSICAVADTRISESYGRLPLQFERNDGQTRKEVRFLARGPGYSLYLTSREAVLVLGAPAVVRMALVGARADPLVIGLDELPGKANYFAGSDPAKWRTRVPTYARVRYRHVYPGIDLVYYGNQRQLEYDFVLAPGADPRRIVLGFRGADNLEIDSQGDLVLRTGGRAVRLHKPVMYQERDGTRHDVAGRYVLERGNQVGFKVAVYDRSRTLVIDPLVLSYSTFLGGNQPDAGVGIAVDAAGNAYVAGLTQSTNFPTTAGAFQTTPAQVFVAKLNPSGSALVYSTFLGGTRFFRGPALAIDADGNAYVTGSAGPGFPTTRGAFQTAFGGAVDSFVTKLNATGSALVYSTYLGGSGGEGGAAIAVDAAGSAYVTGSTSSANFPTANAPQASYAGGIGFNAGDAFVAKLNPTGSALAYSTYLGGSGFDRGAGIALDSEGNAYVVGSTGSADFPTTAGAFQRAFGGGTQGGDAFVAKLNAAGSAFVYSTYLGGSENEEGNAIAVDGQGHAYVTGSTQSGNFPATARAFRRNFSGGFDPLCVCIAADAFVTKLDPAGASLVYSTYLGGNGTDIGLGIAVDRSRNAYVTGLAWSTNFPTTRGAFQSVNRGASDVFVTKLGRTGSVLLYSTYLGGSLRDTGAAIAVDAASDAYVTGQTGFDFPGANNFPATSGALQAAYGGLHDGFVAKFTEYPRERRDRDDPDDLD